MSGETTTTPLYDETPAESLETLDRQIAVVNELIQQEQRIHNDIKRMELRIERIKAQIILLGTTDTDMEDMK